MLGVWKEGSGVEFAAPPGRDPQEGQLPPQRARHAHHPHGGQQEGEWGGEHEKRQGN